LRRSLLNTLPETAAPTERLHESHLIRLAVKNQFFPSSIKAPEEKPQYTFYPDKITYVKTTNRGKTNKFIFLSMW
jgi:hypothetical protein